MTGDHDQASYDGSQQGTTTATGPAGGWYPDPGDVAQLRYYDGTAWTHHVAPRPVPAPAPVPAAGPRHSAAPAHAAVPAYTAAPAYAAAPTYGSGPSWSTAPAGSSGSFSVVRVLITVALVLVVLSGIAGGIRGVAKGRAQAQPSLAPGPALTLTKLRPETVVGRTPSTSAEATQNKIKILGMLRTTLAPLPGSSAAQVEIYGPRPKTAPERGLGIAMLIWVPSATPFGQDDFAAGFSDGAVRAYGGSTTTTRAPDGGVVVCHESVQKVGPTTLCAWVRSGTGLVMMSEYDVPADTVRSDLAGVVAQMTHP